MHGEEFKREAVRLWRPANGLDSRVSNNDVSIDDGLLGLFEVAIDSVRCCVASGRRETHGGCDE